MRGNCRRAIPILVGILVACADTGKTAVLVSDSSGVRITQLPYGLAKGGETWTLASEPLVDIGVGDGEAPYELDRVAGARMLADGSIVIANAGTSELRLFDSRGRFLRTIGRAGAGPGEFRRIVWVQAVEPDTLLVVDSELRRVTAFDAAGDLLSVTSIAGIGVPWPGDVRLADGSFILLTETGDVWQRIRAGNAVADRTDRNTSVLIHYAPDGRLLDTIGRFPGFEEAVVKRNGRPATTYAPWGRQIAWALDGDRVVLGTQQDPELRTFAPDGTIAAILRWDAGDLRITDSDVERFIDLQSAFVSADSSDREAIAARIRALPLPEARPAYGRLIVDDRGILWVSEPCVPMAPPKRWTAIEPGAGVRGQLTVPEAFEVYELGLDFVLGRWTDGVGIEHVRLFTLNR